MAISIRMAETNHDFFPELNQVALLFVPNQTATEANKQKDSVTQDLPRPAWSSLTLKNNKNIFREKKECVPLSDLVGYIRA